MNGKEIVARLKKEGWVLIRINGSHHIMKNVETNKKIPIPVHGAKDIEIGLLKAIEKQTGVKLL
jgi:predicted RNA binding protein YcfA (HicA-like mRNA interferase family)